MVDLTKLIVSDKLFLDIQLIHSFMPNLLRKSWMVSNNYASNSIGKWICISKIKKSKFSQFHSNEGKHRFLDNRPKNRRVKTSFLPKKFLAIQNTFRVFSQSLSSWQFTLLVPVNFCPVLSEILTWTFVYKHFWYFGKNYKWKTNLGLTFLLYLNNLFTKISFFGEITLLLINN